MQPTLDKLASAENNSRAFETIDERFVRISQNAPGFAGAYFDDAGVLTVRTTRLSDAARAKSELRSELLSDARGNVSLTMDVNQQLGTARVALAKYAFDELYSWYAAHVLPLLGRSHGVLSTDIDERENVIVVGVSDELRVNELRSLLLGAGLPEDAFAVEVRAAYPVEPPSGSIESCNPMTAIIPCDDDPPLGGGYATLQDGMRPVPAGVQLGLFVWPSEGSCTLGYNMVLRSSSGSLDPARYFGTASHCTEVMWQMTSFSAGQPVSTAVIGQEVGDPPSFSSSTVSACPPSRACRFSDAAIFVYTSPSLSRHAKIAYPSSTGTLNFNYLETVVGAGDPIVGTVVHRIGRSSGRTVGTVQATCENMAVVLPNGFDTGRTVLCQSRASYSSSGGDSGGPVVSLLPDGSLVARGLHWRGGGGFSPINAVLGELSAAMGAAVGITLSDGQ